MKICKTLFPKLPFKSAMMSIRLTYQDSHLNQCLHCLAFVSAVVASLSTRMILPNQCRHLRWYISVAGMMSYLIDRYRSVCPKTRQSNDQRIEWNRQNGEATVICPIAFLQQQAVEVFGILKIWLTVRSYCCLQSNQMGRIVAEAECGGVD